MYFNVDEFLSEWARANIYNYGSAYTIARQYKEEEYLGTVLVPKGSWYRAGSINLTPGNGNFNTLLKKLFDSIDADCYTTVSPSNSLMIRQCEYYNMTIVGVRQLPDGMYNIWKWEK